MTYQAKVTLLNSAKNTYTRDTITSFLIENMPASCQVELLTHGLLSINSESSRARPVDGVISQVVSDPYLPTWTLNQKGMSGKYADENICFEADKLSRKHITNCLDYAEKLKKLGIHKQDTNKIALSPFTVNNVIVTATSWTNFLNLRLSEDAHPVMQSVAREIDRLLKEVPRDKLDKETGYYSPFPDVSITQAVAKVASVSYANHAKDRSQEDAEVMFNSLADNKHASPFCMVAMPVRAGQIVEYRKRNGVLKKYFIFDNFKKEESAMKYAQYVNWCTENWELPVRLLDTDNFSGWISLRRLESL